MKTNYECTAYFRGIDGLGTCDTECQWWHEGCICAKGSDKWDGKEKKMEKKLDLEYELKKIWIVLGRVIKNLEKKGIKV